MKRRTLLTGLAGGAIAAASGLAYKIWRSGDEVHQASLSDFIASGPFDVCIVGTGPAGCTLADLLSRKGRRVLLIESGVGLTDSEGMQRTSALDVYSSSGVQDYPLQATRLRALGGTSNIWTGRCPRMLPSDFSGTPLAPGNKWPISYANLQPYYLRAEKTLHVVGDKLSASQAPRQQDLEGGSPADISNLRELIEPLGIAVDHPPMSRKRRFLKDDGPVRFGNDLLPALSRRNNVQVLVGSTATGILTDTQGLVTGINVQSPSGVQKQIVAGRYVITCGAVESTRLLLQSRNEHFPDGIGNHADHLGRYFMEHPFLTYSARIPGIKPIGNWQLARTYQYCDALHQRGLGGAVIAFYGEPPRPNRLKIKLGIEMAPSGNNRIGLNHAKVDIFNTPGADIQLDFSEADHSLLKAGEEIVYSIFNKLDAAEIKKHDDLHWSHHHMGTTRMSKLAADGVVDPDLRVHGTKNLYVLSSSVFVTSGTANPTLTIVALAHRLSDHLINEV
jgi:choline dehydrogenase-like flavoprotein